MAGAIARRMRFIFALLVFSAISSRAEESLTGRWEGSAQIPERELRLVIDLAPRNSEWVGSIIVPGLAIEGAALSDIAVNGADVAFAIKTALADPQKGPAKFSAQVAADGKLVGDFTQAGNRAPFSLTKIGAPQIEAVPQSTAITKELEGEWRGEYQLLGYPRKVTLKLQNRGAEGATAEFVIVGRKENKLPVDLVKQEGSFLTVDSHETGLSFEGRAEKGAIAGMVIQGPLEIPVTLRRTN